MEKKINFQLPISFEDVTYFNNEFRGDLIVTEGVIYYFPHTRVSAAKYSPEIGGKDAVEMIGLAGIILPLAGTIPWIHTAADKSIKFGKFLKRKFRPTFNSPRIKKSKLWKGNQSSIALQSILDKHIQQQQSEALKFEEDSVPKPMRFSIEEISNISLGRKFKFDAKFDNHDFRVNLLHRKMLRKALMLAGFL